MSHQPSIGFPAQEQSVSHGDDQQTPIGQEAETHGSARDASDDFRLAREIAGPDLLGAEVGEPEAAIVPTWRLAEHETGQQSVQFRHGKTPSISVLFHHAEREM